LIQLQISQLELDFLALAIFFYILAPLSNLSILSSD